VYRPHALLFQIRNSFWLSILYITKIVYIICGGFVSPTKTKRFGRRLRVTTVKSVREILEKDEGEVRIGDRLGFYQNDRGEIVLRRM